MILGDWEQAKRFWFDVIGYKVYAEEVRRFHVSEAPIRVVSAPARTSKSLSTAADILPYAMPTRPLTSSLHWIVGPRYEQTKEFSYLFDWIVDGRDRFRRDGVELNITRARNNPGHGEMEIIIEHGRDEEGRVQRAIIKALSIQRETDLQGEQVTTATLSEAAEHPERVWTKYLVARTWKAMFPTTPKPHAEWIRKMVELSRTGEGIGIEHFHYPRHANPLYNEELFQREKKRAEKRSSTGRAEDDPMFAEQFLGDWVYYTGRVLPFNPSQHVIPHAAIDLGGTRKFCSVDYGYEDPSVVLFWNLREDGILEIYDEIYERHLTTPALVERVRERMAGREHELDYIVGDPARPEVARLFREAGLRIYDIDKRAMRDRAAGHRRLTDLLTQGPVPDLPGLLVSDKCVNTIYEWKTLHYKEGFRDEYGTTAIEGEDHTFDAARYGVMTRPEPRHERESLDWLRAHRQKVRERMRGRYPHLVAHGLSPARLSRIV